MKGKLWIATVVVGLSLLAQCGRGTSPARKAYESTLALLEGGADTPQAEVAGVKEFLDKYPDTEYAPEILDSGVYLLTDVLDDPESAYRLVSAVMQNVKDPENRRKVEIEYVRVLGKTGRAAELKTVTAGLESGGALDYDGHETVAEAAADGRVWDLALAQVNQALDLATPEALQAENPNRELPEDRIRLYVERRKAASYALKGWALVNLDQPDEGIRNFQKAYEFTNFNYIGVPDSSLLRYWARTSIRQKKYDEAMQMLVPEAVLWGDREAGAIFQEAYVLKNGGTDGLADTMETLRLQNAKVYENFTLPTFQGEKQTFSDLQNGKVTLLTFWFPT
jgi:tetratricopeptide (TPR) repeat protein